MPVSHLFVRLSLAALISVTLIAAPKRAHAEDGVLTFHGGDPGELACPNPPVTAVRPVPEADAPQPPPLEALGSLAVPVVRAQPLIDPSALPGLAMDGRAQRPRRIAVWGDSHAAAGAFMPTLMERLQAQGFTVGTRFLPPSMGRANVRLRALHAFCIGPGWSTELAYSTHERIQVGPGLMNRVADAGPDSYLWLDVRGPDLRPTLSLIQIVYRAPTGAALDISVDDGAEQQMQLPPGGESRTLTIRSDAKISLLKLRVAWGRIVLHGFKFSYERPPLVTFDVFGVPSSTAQGWVTLDPGYLANTLGGDDYDAVMLEYGTNEGSDPRFDPSRYAAGLGEALENLRRVFPRASCLLIGPPDRGVLYRRGGVRLDILAFARNMRAIETVQAEVGAHYGCAHWDWQALMGGPGGSYGWARNAPPLIGRDLTHMTTAGYRVTGEALARSLGF